MFSMKHFLSSKNREELKAQHKHEHDRRVCDRIKAILLRDEGWNYGEIAKALLLSEGAIKQHVQDYLLSHKLKPENGGSCSKLNNQQTKNLLEHLKRHTYLHAKDIAAYVKVTYKIDYTIPGMTCWLKNHGFSYKKPAIVPGKANREAQEKWIKGYEKLKNNLQDNEVICFIDGVHPTHNTRLAYGWIKKGERKEIYTNTGRQRLNLSGAIDITSRKVLVREDVTLNTNSTIAFLGQLEAAYPNAVRIHIFCDNARYYKNKEVAKYLTASKIKMHFLPPYSPNLNPIERLWKLMNERVLYNRYYEKFNDFKNAIFGFLESLIDPLPEIRESIHRRITDNFHLMGSSSFLRKSDENYAILKVR
jgi:transposase